MPTISPSEADRLADGAWFEGYAKAVEASEGPEHWPQLDAEARASARRNTEYVLVQGDLTVDGVVDLGSDVHSIFVVLGDLRAKRIILGDAVLVVRGDVHADEWVFGDMSEGIFSAGGEQIEGDADALFEHLHAPVVAIFNRQMREFRVEVDGEEKASDELVEDVLDDGEVDGRKLRKHLEGGSGLLR